MFGTNPSVPMTFKGLVINQSRVAAVIVLFIVVLNSFEITVCVDIRGKNEDACRVRVPEVCSGGDGERPD